MSSTLTTTPSTSNPNECRRSVKSWMRAHASSMRSTVVVASGTGSPQARAQVRNSVAVANERPSRCPRPCTHIASGRSRTLPGSFWRSAPEAALRGFMNAASPRSMRSSFIWLNFSTG